VSSVVQTSESEMEVECESDERLIRQVSQRVSSADDGMDERTRVTREDSTRIGMDDCDCVVTSR
jgi:hypothetical protein